MRKCDKCGQEMEKFKDGVGCRHCGIYCADIDKLLSQYGIPSKITMIKGKIVIEDVSKKLVE